MNEQPTCFGCCLNEDWQWPAIPEKPDFSNINLNFECLTNEEKEILNNLKYAWNKFVGLDNKSTDDINEFRCSIHKAQQLIALRVARRIDPDVWAQPE